MKLVDRLFFFIIWIAILGAGCAYPRHGIIFNSPAMPEEVYINTPVKQYYRPNIVIVNFNAPAYASRMGEKASGFLYSELLKLNFEANISLRTMPAPIGPDRLVRFIRENKYDFLVTGDILYCFDGGISGDSRVEEEIKIYTVSGKAIHLAGYAKAMETASPKSFADYVLIQKKGKSAPFAEDLLKMNAAKFAQLVDNMFAEQLSKKQKMP